MIRLLLKSLAASGFLSGAFLIDSTNINSISKRNQKEKISQSTTKLQTITSLEDIKLFEKENNCNFIFVGRWAEKQVYKFEEFLKHFENLKDKVISGANSWKEKCKSRNMMPLSWNGSSTFQIDYNNFKK